jgi:hypothetical protein
MALLSLSLATVCAVAQHARAQTTTLPANVQTDRATIQQDQMAMQNALGQLRNDEAANNTAAAAADRTAVRLARLKLESDFAQLHQDAQPMLQPDKTAVVSALTELHADQIASNADAIAADQTALAVAETHLRADQEAVYGGLGGGGAGHGWKHRH